MRSRIGLSTVCLSRLTEMSLEQAIDTACEEGFETFELQPRLYGGPQSFDAKMREKLKDRLSCFETLTVHNAATLMDGTRRNIASSVTSIRRESIEYCREVVRLSLDIGAKVCTFHRGRADEKTFPEQVRAANLTFAQTASALAKDSGLQMGYEHFDVEMTREIDRPEFGILFDIGHAARFSEGDRTTGTLQFLEEAFPFIVEFHVHGVHMPEQGDIMDHLPLHASNALDYRRVIPAIKQGGFEGPFILEIGANNPDLAENVKNAVAAREELITMWAES